MHARVDVERSEVAVPVAIHGWPFPGRILTLAGGIAFFPTLHALADDVE